MYADATPIQKPKKLLRTGAFLKCHCPHCGEYLIEGDSIRLGVLAGDGTLGELRLNPRLNFFDHASTIHLEELKEVQDVTCPHCHHSLKESLLQCTECGSRMGRMMVRSETGDFDFYFCLRKQCHWHDISKEGRDQILLEAAGFHGPENENEFLQDGTRLQFYCPSCDGSLVHEDDLIIHVKDKADHLGVLKLSPYLNIFTSECSLFISDDEEVADMICPKCNSSLCQPVTRCEICGAKASRFRAAVSVLDMDFYICTRKNCHWHGLSVEDRQRILLDESLEW